MDIKMPISGNRYYRMVMRFQDCERPGRCFRLRVEELTLEEKKLFDFPWVRGDIPTCKIMFYDFEYYRFLEGRITENTEEKLVLSMAGGKEYEFSPFVWPDEAKT